jgi:large subunit ribosomal protein L5
MSIGCIVTLRGDRMYRIFDRLVNVALRVRDFRGVSTKSFDGQGNYARREGSVDLPRNRLRQGGKTKGMNISITTTAKTDAEG